MLQFMQLQSQAGLSDWTTENRKSNIILTYFTDNDFKLETQIYISMLRSTVKEVWSEGGLKDRQSHWLEKRNGKEQVHERPSIYKRRKRGTLHGSLNSESNNYYKLKLSSKHQTLYNSCNIHNIQITYTFLLSIYWWSHLNYWTTTELT